MTVLEGQPSSTHPEKLGPIVLLVFACTDSEAGDNPYGPNPKEFNAHIGY